MRVPRRLLLLALVAALAAAWGRSFPAQRASDMVALPAPSRSLVLLPFVPRGAPPSAWSELQPVLEAGIRSRGFEIVAYDEVERYLRKHRLRDTSILSRDELEALVRGLGADRLLTGTIYRWEGEPYPVVSLAGSIIDQESGQVMAMTITTLEGSTLIGPLGRGGPVTMERTIREAVAAFVEGLLMRGEALGRRGTPKLLKKLALAPEPLAYLSPDLRERRIREIIVMPFRNNVDRPGAGHVVADAVTWCLLEVGDMAVTAAGDATRRLLERGWRTGRAVGKEEVTALRGALGVDAVLMGSIDFWDDGDRLRDRPPAITISARLLDAASGEILWTATHERHGAETRSFYQLGNVRLPEALVARSAREILTPLLHRLKKTSETIGEARQ